MFSKIKAYNFYNSNIFFITFVFYLCLFFNPNNKTLFLAFILLGLLYYKYLRNFRLSLLLSTVSSLIFFVGKTYIIELIPPSPYIAFDYPTGFNTSVVLTVFNIFNIAMLFVILRDLFLKKKLIFALTKPILWLFMYYLWLIISSLLASKRPELSFLYSLQSSGSFVLLLYVCFYGLKNKKLPSYLLSIFLAMVFFEGILVGLQFINHHHLGLSIEPTKEIELFGEGVDEDYFQYRPIGTFSHANSLAAFVLPLLFLFMPFLSKHIFKLGFMMGLLILIFSLGRSTWISYIIGLLFFLYIVEKRWKLKLFQFDFKAVLKFINLKSILISALIVIICIYIVLPRVFKTFYIFEETGGGWTRIIMARETLNIIMQYPIFGVGQGMGSVEVFDFSPRDVNSHFFSGVHNGFLSIALESGFVGLFLFFLFFYFSLKEVIDNLSKLNQKKKLIAFGGITAIMVLMINAIFQPIFNLNFIILIIVFLYSLNYN